MGQVVTIDTNDPSLLEKPTYELLEPATYDFEVSNKLQIVDSTKGKPMIKVELACLAEDHKGAKVFDNVSLTDKAKWKFAQFCKSCGVESADGQIDLDAFQGATCSAKIGQRTYNKTDGSKGMSNEVVEYLWTE